jgi:hypothetical protein
VSFICCKAITEDESAGLRRSTWRGSSKWRAMKGPLWTTQQLRGFRRAGEHGGVPLFGRMSDGPYTTEWIEEQLLVGRVAGISNGPLGNLLAPTAGYMDEDAHNTAFDESEYLNVLIAAGYEVLAVRRKDGGFSWPGQRLTPAQEAVVFAQMRKRSAASQADSRIAAECVRRGFLG